MPASTARSWARAGGRSASAWAHWSSRQRRLVIFFFQVEVGIRDFLVTGVQTCALPISADIQPDERQGDRLPARRRRAAGRPQHLASGCPADVPAAQARKAVPAAEPV